jgi:FeS assembly SUF system regulator
VIRFTKHTDYGIVLLTQFAHAPRETLLTARDLAAEARVSLPMVSKILKMLTRAGLLVSHRGIHGGYALTRSPEDISVAEIIHSLEGMVSLTECTQINPSDCALERECPVRSHWHVINHAINGVLQRITLADMIRPSMTPVRWLAEANTDLPRKVPFVQIPRSQT